MRNVKSTLRNSIILIPFKHLNVDETCVLRQIGVFDWRTWSSNAIKNIFKVTTSCQSISNRTCLRSLKQLLWATEKW